MGEYVQNKGLKTFRVDMHIKLEIKMLIIKLFLLDIYSLANNKLQ